MKARAQKPTKGRLEHKLLRDFGERVLPPERITTATRSVYTYIYVEIHHFNAIRNVSLTNSCLGSEFRTDCLMNKGKTKEKAKDSVDNQCKLSPN
ncbi:CLUMA_CG021154, isoform A [Clunio marinus]|uniref:CLUMA_CG021154, isoform A n=1 Tax=Clunio marinus TaxID=568069 RepID=A0A1J1J9S0_9DIPT|nr:CLUMA_CG021154, isoform A [Clunio marinus]